jgi:hypothetical protein
MRRRGGEKTKKERRRERLDESMGETNDGITERLGVRKRR